MVEHGPYQPGYDLMPFNHNAVEERLEASADAVAETYKPTISEACDIADERRRKERIAEYVEALQCFANPDCRSVSK